MRKTYIFIIGESYSKNCMKIYLSWNTTPKLKELLDKKEIFNFYNIYSNYTQTMSVLSLVLTKASLQMQHKSYFNSLFIIEVLTTNDFETI